jgi:hypothetical protein
MILLLPIGLFAQEVTKVPAPEKKKGTFYITWGYNRDFYSNSDIHFENHGADNYDFTLYALRAHDRSGFDELLTSELSIPQYMYRLGYYFNDKHDLGIEINFDHTKYVMDNNQVAHLKGDIHGVYYDKDTLVSPDFLKFEHTNGGNFLMVNGLKRHNLFIAKNNQFAIGAVLKIGAGIVIPKTDVTLFGERVDNCFHLAGYVVGADLGFRAEFFNHFFLETSFKSTYADYNKVLTVNGGLANHTFFTQELLLGAGFQFAW